MIDEGEEQEDQVERKSEIMEKAYVKTAKEVLGCKKKKAMVQTGGLDFGRPKESHKNRDGKMSTDKRIGKLQDRLGWIRENGLKRLQRS